MGAQASMLLMFLGPADNYQWMRHQMCSQYVIVSFFGPRIWDLKYDNKYLIEQWSSMDEGMRIWKKW